MLFDKRDYNKDVTNFTILCAPKGYHNKELEEFFEYAGTNSGVQGEVKKLFHENESAYKTVLHNVYASIPLHVQNLPFCPEEVVSGRMLLDHAPSCVPVAVRELVLPRPTVPWHKQAVETLPGVQECLVLGAAVVQVECIEGGAYILRLPESDEKKAELILRNVAAYLWAEKEQFCITVGRGKTSLLGSGATTSTQMACVGLITSYIYHLKMARRVLFQDYVTDLVGLANGIVRQVMVKKDADPICELLPKDLGEFKVVSLPVMKAGMFNMGMDKYGYVNCNYKEATQDLSRTGYVENRFAVQCLVNKERAKSKKKDIGKFARTPDALAGVPVAHSMETGLDNMDGVHVNDSLALRSAKIIHSLAGKSGEVQDDNFAMSECLHMKVFERASTIKPNFAMCFADESQIQHRAPIAVDTQHILLIEHMAANQKPTELQWACLKHFFRVEVGNHTHFPRDWVPTHPFVGNKVWLGEVFYKDISEKEKTAMVAERITEEVYTTKGGSRNGALEGPETDGYASCCGLLSGVSEEAPRNTTNNATQFNWNQLVLGRCCAPVDWKAVHQIGSVGYAIEKHNEELKAKREAEQKDTVERLRASEQKIKATELNVLGQRVRVTGNKIGRVVGADVQDKSGEKLLPDRLSSPFRDGGYSMEDAAKQREFFDELNKKYYPRCHGERSDTINGAMFPVTAGPEQGFQQQTVFYPASDNNDGFQQDPATAVSSDFNPHNVNMDWVHVRDSGHNMADAASRVGAGGASSSNERFDGEDLDELASSAALMAAELADSSMDVSHISGFSD